MRDLTADPYFRDDSIQQVTLAGDAWSDELQRHRLSEFHVLGAIDLANTSGAEGCHDPVAVGQHRSGGKTSGRSEFVGGAGWGTNVRDRHLRLGRCFRVDIRSLVCHELPWLKRIPIASTPVTQFVKLAFDHGSGFRDVPD